MFPVQLKHPSSSFCNNLWYAYNCNQFMFAHLTNFTLYIYTHIYIYSCVCVYIYMHTCVKIVAIFVFCHILHMGFWPFVTLDQFIKILGHYSVLMFLINWLLFAIVKMYKLCFIYFIIFFQTRWSQAYFKPFSSLSQVDWAVYYCIHPLIHADLCTFCPHHVVKKRLSF